MLGNMSKVEINKEIVSMRHTVRRARVAVVRKLIKESKILRAKRGNEAQLQKYKRKADRLIEEVLASKKIKDDEISRFAITNTKTLQEVLADQCSNPDRRIMTRLAHHKILATQVIAFKEKFPNYEDHLGPGKRKLMKLERKTNKEAKKNAKTNLEEESPTEKTTMERNEMKSENSEKSSDENEDIPFVENSMSAEPDETESSSDEGHPLLRNLEPGSILRVKPPGTELETKKKKSPAINESERQECKQKTSHLDKTNSSESESNSKASKQIKVISKEATVKRFKDLLQEETSVNNSKDATETDQNDTKIKLDKEVDSFFMTENGESEYLSVVVPKAVSAEEEEQDGYARNTRHDRRDGRGKKFSKGENQRFFTRIDESALPRWNKGGSKRNDASASGAGSEKRWKGKSDKREENRSGGNEKRSSTANESMHPSWAAKKKQQEILKQGFQGKKIIFD